LCHPGGARPARAHPRAPPPPPPPPPRPPPPPPPPSAASAFPTTLSFAVSLRGLVYAVAAEL